MMAVTSTMGCSVAPQDLESTEAVGEDEITLDPKLFARILRFQKAVSLVDHEPSWAAIAQRSGYYDQAHLIRDFQQFSGDSPTEFLRRRLPDGGGVRD